MNFESNALMVFQVSAVDSEFTGVCQNEISIRSHRKLDIFMMKKSYYQDLIIQKHLN